MQQPGCQQKETQYLTAGRHKGHENSRSAHPPQIVQIQGQSGLEQNDDQGHLPQIGGDGKNGLIQQIQSIGAQQDAGCQHADDTGQPQLLADSRHGKTRQKDKSKGRQHNISSFGRKKADASATTIHHRSHQLLQAVQGKIPTGEPHSRLLTCFSIPDRLRPVNLWSKTVVFDK